MDEAPEKLQVFMYYLTKNAANYSYADFLKDIDISEDEYEKIKEFFSKLGIKLYV